MTSQNRVYKMAAAYRINMRGKLKYAGRIRAHKRLTESKVGSSL